MDRLLKRFNMKSYSPNEAVISKGDRVNKDQSPMNDIESKSMEIRHMCL